jgi:hypothetical protein
MGAGGAVRGERRKRGRRVGLRRAAAQEDLAVGSSFANLAQMFPR